MKEERITNKKENLVHEISDFVGDFIKKINQLKDESADGTEDLISVVSKAHEEWQSAEKFFNNVSDPDLIDHAIYKVEAAKSRYTYLLKQAKKEGIKVNFH